MSLTPGTRVGPYEILAPLGAGGMGEVYRARDPRLGRDVAIKALPPAFARDPERLARFEREARLLASLSHPNIAGIHGLEESGGSRYLVLELVEGETLAQRLARGRLPLDEALEVARQIASGVEAAHENGVVHRDLKPGNVMLTPSGGVKVLDFGLAKSGTGESAAPEGDLASSPTLTHAATQAGVILGTAAYMSPEQARGRPVDKRTDIWSFGCVLYECLAERPLFQGETVSDLIAHILKGEPDWSGLPAGTPPRVRALLARCLARDPRERLRDIGEARVALAAAAVGSAEDAVPAPTAPARLRGVPWWVAVSGAIVLAGAAVAVFRVLSERPPAPVRRLEITAEHFETDWFCGPVLSPDGRRVAYISTGKVWARDLDQLAPRPVAEVSASTPLCWAPDSRALLFADQRRIWRVSAESGTPTVLCEIPGSGSVLGIAWSRSGTIALSVWRGGIYRVAAGGGEPVLWHDVDPGTTVDYHGICWLPDGSLLYVPHWKNERESGGGSPATFAVFDGRKQIPVPGEYATDEAMPRVSSDGHLLFARQGANAGIWAVRFDAARRRTSGDPFLVAPDAAWFSTSDDGSLLYAEGAGRDFANEFVWVDRAGKVIATVGTGHPGIAEPVISPDGRRLAFSAGQGNDRDIWIHDLARGTETRLTFGNKYEMAPEWLSSSRLAYVEGENLMGRVLSVNADGSGDLRELAPSAGIAGLALFQSSIVVAPDGRSAVRIVDDGSGRGRARIGGIRPDGTLGELKPLFRVQPEPDVGQVAISPDGRLVAYVTNNPGQNDVFLTRYPGGEGLWQVGTEGGRAPRWARGSGELFFVAGSGPTRRSLVAVSVEPATDPPVGTITRLFDLGGAAMKFATEAGFDVSADGQRFLFARNTIVPGAPSRRMILVENWLAGAR